MNIQNDLGPRDQTVAGAAVQVRGHHHPKPTRREIVQNLAAAIVDAAIKQNIDISKLSINKDLVEKYSRKLKVMREFVNKDYLENK